MLAEANRDKHINFIVEERGETEPATGPLNSSDSNTEEVNKKTDNSKKAD